MPTLLITGANRGLGLELCKQYLDQDWQVHATCRNPETSNELDSLADNYPDLLTIHALDVSDEQQITALKSEIGDRPIDILFNNAGIYGEESNHFGSINSETWLETFKVNVISPLKLVEAFVTNIANSERKIIANMSSKMGSIADNGFGGRYAYRSSKTALNSTMMSASIDLRERDITVLMLHPGWVRTDMGGVNGELSAEESATCLRKTLTNASILDSGKFFDIDGSIIPW